MKVPVLWLWENKGMSNIQSIDKQYVANTYGRFDLVLTHGQGSTVWDEDGNKYILDGMSAIGEDKSLHF